MTSTASTQPSLRLPHLAQPIFRSGAVARLVGMPVATLRIWEQRYQAVRPTTAASGHRLYSAADVERVTMLRRLTEQGHAIGLLAVLDIEQMRVLMNAAKVAVPTGGSGAPPKQIAMRIVVVGQALASRLQRWVDRQPGEVLLQYVAVFGSLADAAQAAQGSAETGVDLLLWQSASLQPGVGHELRAAQVAWRANAAAVVYRHSSAAGRTELTGAGAALYHEPADDASLGQWLTTLVGAAAPEGKATSFPGLADLGAMGPAYPVVSAPRFTDLALTEFAGLSSALACECPSHLAQLLLQISSFETYSGDCANRSEADAQLHAYLQRVAGTARMLFETALEHVAVAEGLLLPHAPHGPDGNSFATAANGQPEPIVSLI